MSMTKNLPLTRAQYRVMGALAENAYYAKGARRDTMLERTLSEARYFIRGAFALDIQDDKELARILAAIYDGTCVPHKGFLIQVDFIDE